MVNVILFAVDTVLSEMDLVSQKLNNGAYERGICTQIASLCENLKMFGPQLESVYKGKFNLSNLALGDRVFFSGNFFNFY